jgi:hypothetical protein
VTSRVATGLWASARRDLVALLSYVDGSELRFASRALIGFTGGPTADFNLALIDACAEDEALFVEYVELAYKKGAPCLFMLSGACAGRLERLAKGLGLTEAGTAPLMALEEGPAFQVQAPFSVERVTEKAGMGVEADLVASAFALDRQWVGRTFCAETLLEAPVISFFLAYKEGEAFSGVTTTTSGTTVGIWSMATPANRQRMGAGRAALVGAIEHHRRLGATTFYLIATPAGKPLYESLGFTIVETAHLWVAGPAEQSPH